MINFMYFAIGLLALTLAVALPVGLLRLTGRLGRASEELTTTIEEINETLPEVRHTISNLNQITSGVNVGLQAAEARATRFSGRLGEKLRGPAAAVAAAAYGVKVGAASLWRSYSGGKSGGQ